MKKIVVLFPGIRGTEIPLLYFAGQKYVDLGYDKLFIAHPKCKKEEITIDLLFQNAKIELKEIQIQTYDEIILVGKSMGSVVAGKMNEEFKLNATLILLTPIEQTLTYINSHNKIKLVAAGTLDRHLPTEILRQHCRNEKVPYYIEPGVGHSMELKGALERNLEVVRNVVSRC